MDVDAARYTDRARAAESGHPDLARFGRRTRPGVRNGEGLAQRDRTSSGRAERDHGEWVERRSGNGPPPHGYVRDRTQQTTKALQEMHTAEFDLQKAFLEKRPWEERDRAIKKARQTRYAWISLGAKFFRNWPV